MILRLSVLVPIVMERDTLVGRTAQIVRVPVASLVQHIVVNVMARVTIILAVLAKPVVVKELPVSGFQKSVLVHQQRVSTSVLTVAMYTLAMVLEDVLTQYYVLEPEYFRIVHYPLMQV